MGWGWGVVGWRGQVWCRMGWSGVVGCGGVWWGVVGCGVPWCGVPWRGVPRRGAVCCGVLCCVVGSITPPFLLSSLLLSRVPPFLSPHTCWRRRFASPLNCLVCLASCWRCLSNTRCLSSASVARLQTCIVVYNAYNSGVSRLKQ